MVSSLLLSWWSWRDAIHPEIDTMVQWTFVLGWHMLHPDIAKGWQRKSISAASWMCSRHGVDRSAGYIDRRPMLVRVHWAWLGRSPRLGTASRDDLRRPAARTAVYCHA